MLSCRPGSPALHLCRHPQHRPGTPEPRSHKQETSLKSPSPALPAQPSRGQCPQSRGVCKGCSCQGDQSADHACLFVCGLGGPSHVSLSSVPSSLGLIIASGPSFSPVLSFSRARTAETSREACGVTLKRHFREQCHRPFLILLPLSLQRPSKHSDSSSLCRFKPSSDPSRQLTFVDLGF